MTTTRTRITGLALAAILATGACSSTPEETPEPVVTPTVGVTTPADEATPEVEETAAEVPTPEVVEAAVGDIVTEEESESLPEGQSAFPLEDGTLILVDRYEPLPDAVVQEAAAPAVAKMVEIGTSDPNRAREVMEAAQAEASKIMGLTGKYVIMIGRAHDAEGWKYQSTGESRIIPAPSSKAPVLAAAEEFVASQDEPARWAIIDATGE